MKLSAEFVKVCMGLGLNQNQIAAGVGCSRQAVNYWAKPGQKEKNTECVRRWRANNRSWINVQAKRRRQRERAENEA